MKNLNEMIQGTNGKVFKVVFIKKDGTERTMQARLGVKKGLVGAGRSKPLPENMVCVFDMASDGYRTINLNTVTHFKCGSLEYVNNDNQS